MQAVWAFTEFFKKGAPLNFNQRAILVLAGFVGFLCVTCVLPPTPNHKKSPSEEGPLVEGDYFRSLSRLVSSCST